MTQTKLRFCRLCDIVDSIPVDIGEHADRLYSLLDDDEKAPEVLIKERLSVCDECERNMGGTCLECGCYCIIRSFAVSKHCPVGKW